MTLSKNTFSLRVTPMTSIMVAMTMPAIGTVSLISKMLPVLICTCTRAPGPTGGILITVIKRQTRQSLCQAPWIGTKVGSGGLMPIGNGNGT